MINPRDVIIRPLISEKSMGQMQEGKYTFVVARDANKSQIREAVEKIFNVDVEKVNTIRLKGKLRRRGIHRGYTPKWKKAVVTLKEGQTIKLFEGMM